MRILSRMEVGTKLALVTTLILALFSLWIYIYFPEKLQRQAVDALAQRATSIADVTAQSLAPALESRDPVAIASALTVLRRNRDLTYFVVKDADGNTAASFNEMVAASAGPFVESISAAGTPHPVVTGMTTGEPSETIAERSEDGHAYRTTTPVRFHGRRIGTLIVGFSLDRVLDETNRNKAIIAFVTLLSFGLGVLAVFALSTVITGPLHRIAETAERIAAGDINSRAAVESKDEVGRLAKTFNLMVDRIAAARAELETLNRTLEQRVEERTQELRGEITERRRSEERYRLLFERNLAGVYIASTDGTIISCNDACARLFGFEFAEEFLENGAAIRYMNEHHRESVMRRLEANGAVFNEEVQLRDTNDQPVWALENVRLVEGRAGQPTLEGILLDITDRKRAEEEIAYRAYHDELTGLPNRPLFADRVEVALANASRKKQRVAAMFLDLDDLKIVNDTLGHATGDTLLKMVATRLTETLRQGDTIARVGGDEFVVLLPEVNHEADALRAAHKILRAISKPFVLDADELHISASIGVAIGPRDGDSAETLIRNADGAMYRAKQSGGNRVELYRHVGPAILGRIAQEEELRQAMDRDEFVLLIQPQVRIETRELVGVEALVRWNHPERGMIEPAGFISVAEHTGLITVLGEIVLRKACEHGVEWQSAGFTLPRVSVNVSPRQLYQRNFVGMVERALAMTGFDPSFLELELTESLAVSKSERIRDILQSLREIGVAIAVDDFGTGQSSLTYIKDFPVDTVKIDRSFVIDVVQKRSDQSIVSAVLLVANELGLRTIAEGVETDEQCEFLRTHGCQEIQGYLISRPIAPPVLQKMFLTVKSTNASPVDRRQTFVRTDPA
ncbi:MAG TPA: EAL domain-containing protein [Thermoanaerobaculia bacterium]|nr:EAL domain-containing protein [Thermoanaerobaculia bacterium]